VNIPSLPQNLNLISIDRAELQKAFFPPTYQDGEVTPLLKPGDKRMWTALRVFIELRDTTTLQIPFREASKVCFLFCQIYLDFIFFLNRTGSGMGRMIRNRDGGYGSPLGSI
jgi:hypothetical protein